MYKYHRQSWLGLASQLKNVLRSVHSTGLRVVGAVCDQGATKTAAINILKNDSKRSFCQRDVEYEEEFYDVDWGEEVLNLIHLDDPPHLLKGIRNNLLNKNVKFTMNGKEKETRWSDIVELYK